MYWYSGLPYINDVLVPLQILKRWNNASSDLVITHFSKTLVSQCHTVYGESSFALCITCNPYKLLCGTLWYTNTAVMDYGQNIPVV